LPPGNDEKRGVQVRLRENISSAFLVRFPPTPVEKSLKDMFSTFRRFHTPHFIIKVAVGNERLSVTWRTVGIRRFQRDLPTFPESPDPFFLLRIHIIEVTTFVMIFSEGGRNLSAFSQSTIA